MKRHLVINSTYKCVLVRKLFGDGGDEQIVQGPSRNWVENQVGEVKIAQPYGLTNIQTFINSPSLRLPILRPV